MTKKRYDLCTTALDKRGRFICTAKNDYLKSHPLQKKLSIAAGYAQERCYLHSEVRCLLRAMGMRKHVDTLVVERYLADGSPAVAMPCNSCKNAIKLSGVRVVRYTTEIGFKEWRVGKDEHRKSETTRCRAIKKSLLL